MQFVLADLQKTIDKNNLCDNTDCEISRFIQVYFPQI